LLLTCRIESGLGKIVAQTECAIFSDLSESFAQLFVGKRTTLAEKLGEVLQYALRGLDILRFPIDGNVLSAGINANVEQRFKILNVLVVNAKQRFQPARWQFDLFQKLSRSLSAGDKVTSGGLADVRERESTEIAGICCWV